MKLKIVSLIDRPELHHAAAKILMDAFREHWGTVWATLETALEEVESLCTPEHILLGAIDSTSGELYGWVGGISEYEGNVWELHPIAVSPSSQRLGVGRALVQAFESEVAQRGGITIMLGSDDEDNMTSIGGVDLYPDPLAQLVAIQNVKNHPFVFYQKMGFVLVGVIPDANGFGKPDILMAKRVKPSL